MRDSRSRLNLAQMVAIAGVFAGLGPSAASMALPPSTPRPARKQRPLPHQSEEVRDWNAAVDAKRAARAARRAAASTTTTTTTP